MTDAARDLLRKALEMDDAERAALAAELLASLSSDSAGFDEQEPDPAWVAEIERRAAAAAADPEGGIPWEQAREEILARLRRPT